MYKLEIMLEAYKLEREGFNISPEHMVRELYKKGYKTRNEVYSSLKDLEEKELLLGQQSPTDGRFRQYRLTNRGRGIIPALQEFKEKLRTVREPIMGGRDNLTKRLGYNRNTYFTNICKKYGFLVYPRTLLNQFTLLLCPFYFEEA